MAKPIKRKRKHQRYSLPAAGSSPGLVRIDEHALPSIITLYTYTTDSYVVEDISSLSSIKERLQDKRFNYWVEIKGFKSSDLFEILSSEYGIHNLVLEDISSTYQRPKLEEYDHYVFAVSRMLYFGEEATLENEQFSFILMDHALFTFQERYEECLAPVKARLKNGKGNIRIAGSSYLMYALMDIIIDKYFEVLGAWGNELDEIEERLFDKPNKQIMFDTQNIKRNLIGVRRVAWPERDKLNDILRSDSMLITDQTKMFIRDAYDHCIQIIDIVESLKEISASNIDMYLSIISNRMNEIMKVLTIMSSIFIPLTFIAGIYGMNFSREDPETGKILHSNMPELYQEHGYLYTMLVMALIAVLQIIYFWRKGWFK